MRRHVIGLVIGLALITSGCASATSTSSPTPTRSPTQQFTPYYPEPFDPIPSSDASVKGAHLLSRQTGHGAINLVFNYARTGLNQVMWGFACSGPGTVAVDKGLGVPVGGPSKCMYSTTRSYSMQAPFSAGSGFSFQITDPNTKWIVEVYGWK